ncbi:hypothetical protein R1flu_018302 [Riccia fluitans]|uniref:Uncharacterized protein n=1 Tax=Riccia fluitans TaxID=41844 RepID=A0ABD1ZFF7_9MARC
MGYNKSTASKGSKYIPISPRNSRVYDHYDYAFDAFESYDEDDFESEEITRSEAALLEESSAARPSDEPKVSEETEASTRWEKLKSDISLEEVSNTWFSQEPFDLETRHNIIDWKITQTDPETCSKSRSTQTHRVGKTQTLMLYLKQNYSQAKYCTQLPSAPNVNSSNRQGFCRGI